MASCYGKIAAPSSTPAEVLRYLPIRTTLPSGTQVEVDFFRPSEHEAGHRLLNDVIEEGLSWPFENALDMDGFRAYFLSHAAFVVRAVEPSFRPDQPPDKSPPSPGIVSASADERLEEQAEGKPYDGVETENHHPPTVQRLAAAKSRTDACCPMSLPVPSAPPLGEGLPSLERRSEVDVWGAFYIKPNFPGRCSHVCNGGFITDPSRRRRGVATLMGHAFLRFAKDLGYKSSYFNLVFRSNEASLRLWRGLGFTELAVVPKAARLKGINGLVDASQFHYDLEELHQEDLPEDVREQDSKSRTSC